VLPDDVLAGLATIKPVKVEDLAQLRRLDAGMKRQFGSTILTAVATAQGLPEADLPERPARPAGQARDSLVSLFNAAVSEIAHDSDLPASLLVPRAALERLAREVPIDRGEFERTLGLHAWRLALVADPLWRLCGGGAALRIEGYASGDPKVRVLDDQTSE
jgi:ribonuclease D